MASAFPLAHHYRAVLAEGTWVATSRRICEQRGWYTQNLREITVALKLCYHAPRRENLASRRGPFGGFSPSKEAPKPRWDRNSYVCGIISVIIYPPRCALISTLSLMLSISSSYFRGTIDEIFCVKRYRLTCLMISCRNALFPATLTSPFGTEMYSYNFF